MEERSTSTQECFLCALDPRHSCRVRQLQGRILTAFEYTLNGEKIPIIVIHTGTERVEIRLTQYYRKFVQELHERGKEMQNLTLRLYHLPAPPVITEYKGQPGHIYTTNSYTLAVLEPDVLLNITDLNHAEYCSRQYLLNRLIASPSSAATIRGNLVHHCFKELLKEHDRGELMKGHAGKGQETPLATMYRHFEQALEQHSIELALANVQVEEIRADVAPHLESLATWFQNQSSTLWNMPAMYVEGQTGEAGKSRSGNHVRAETFLLAPEIGLRGRLDLFWQQSGQQRLLELKTGGGQGNLPRRDHRWQVDGYHSLLTVRRNSQMKKALATLLYSGTPQEAQAFGIPFTIKELQRVNETRNILVLSHVTGTASAPPGPSRCTKCFLLHQCEQVSSLLTWQPPKPDTNEQLPSPPVAPGRPQRYAPVAASNGGVTQTEREPGAYSFSSYSEEDRVFFARYYHLLHIEGREGEQQQALLWKTSVEERIERGTAISELKLVGEPQPTGQGEWEQEFLCNNTSELREGDEILLSDGDPITGEVVTGTIKRIGAEHVRVWSPELISHPTLIDRYDTNLVHVRTVQNLSRWLQADVHLRELVAGKLHPRFSKLRVEPRPGFNPEQNLAVERALQMQDYLLVQGPPGTGKTSVIAEIVKRLCQLGQRVMLAAFTNQAVDNMLKRLDAEGFHDYVRLGHDRSVDAGVRVRLLQNLVSPGERGNGQPLVATNVALHQLHQDAIRQVPGAREILHKTPVIASTTATWSSEKYSLQFSNGVVGGPGEEQAMQFDVAIIDEASQLTIPAILGALRLAKRFILVGDEKQLPPLVLSNEAAGQGLADSLFSYLKHLDDDYKKEHDEENSTVSACVSLRMQYRMNRWISNFSSKIFYEGTLEADPSVAKRVLEVATTGPWLATETPATVQALQPAYPLVFLDVQRAEESEAIKSSNAEARAVREVVKGLLARGIAQKDIGIIAPYRAQVANLRRHLFSADESNGWQALSPDTPMSIDTVDRFQGGERMVIIMSFATSRSPGAESPLHEFLTRPNRLNVALTRAQRKLILVGSVPALEGLPYFSRLLAYCRSMNTVIAYTQ
jgi:DNA replication ATP-dependent helicase/nuclease Dna2